MQDEKRKIRISEIAGKLSVPKYFLGKIMQQMVKAGLLQSYKGPYGGFSLAAESLSTSLLRLTEITDGRKYFNTCILQLKECEASNPCPLHMEMEEMRKRTLSVFTEIKIGDLLIQNKDESLKSLSTVRGPGSK